MSLYGMWVGGIMQCGGKKKDLTSCRSSGYTIEKESGYWCRWHKEQGRGWNRT